VAVRLNRWEIKRRKVTAHSGGHGELLLDEPVPKTGYGYFFQRDARTLDTQGEWFYDACQGTAACLLHHHTAGYQISTVDTTFYSNKANITVHNLAFTGANKAGFMQTGNSAIVVKNCDFYTQGGEGAASWFATNVRVDNCTTLNCLGSGLRIYGPSTGTANVVITGCSVNRTALIAGMEITDMSSAGNGINANGGDGVTVMGNTIRNSGYNAITWHGNNVSIKHNFIDSFCSVRDDGGGIYTYTGKGSTPVRGTNRVIEENIIVHGIGASDGAPGTDASPNGKLARYSANGIYNDEGTWDVTMRRNTIGWMSYQGFQGNGNSYLIMEDNTVYATPISHSYQRLADENRITNMVSKRNIYYPYEFRLRDQAIDLPTLITPDEVVRNFGISDSNWYATPPGADTSLNLQTQKTTTPSGFVQSYRPFSYMTGTIGIEKASRKVDYGGILAYNASNLPAAQKFPGMSKKDVQGRVYNDSAVIAPWSSLVLLDNGTVPMPNLAPLSLAGPDQTASVSTTKLTLSGSGKDTDGTIASYSWRQTQGTAVTMSNRTAQVTDISGYDLGTYAFELTVRDNVGGVGTDVVVVSIMPQANLYPPVAEAGRDTVIKTNALVVTGTSRDAYGAVTGRLWAKLSGPAGGTIDNPKVDRITITDLLAGEYVFRYAVTDSDGLTGVDDIKVTVLDAARLK
jgi:hypothetical protein